jgi:hypothetical protein
MATAPVNIANDALTLLGVEVISSMTEDSEAARKMNSIFASCRDQVLESADWNFARKTEALALIADEESLEWDYIYQRPAKCIKVRRVFNETTIDLDKKDDHEEMIAPTSGAQAIGADIEEAYAKYTYQVTDTSTFPIGFIKALAANMAATSAKALTGDNRPDLAQLFQALVSVARAANGNEGKAKDNRPSPYEDARA